jgi:hypothetical protein
MPDGTWGYHALVLSLANTSEVLSVVNRSGNRPSHEGAAEQVDRTLTICFQGGLRRVLLRGDTDFSQTEHLDRWTADGRVRFIFGYDAMANVVAIAEKLPERAWRKLERPPRYTVQTEPRQRPDHVKEQIVVARQFENLRLQSEAVAEFNYRPTACQQTYRMVGCGRTSPWKRASRCCSTTSATSSTSPTIGSARPTRSSSRPTTAANKKTWWPNCKAACGR